jgi:hypothetical protein
LPARKDELRKGFLLPNLYEALQGKSFVLIHRRVALRIA